MAIDLNAIRAEFQRMESSGQSNFLDNFVPMPSGEGSVIIRLLPPKDDAILPFMATRTHKINGKNIHCPCTLVGEKWVGNCAVCNYYKSLWKQVDSASAEDAKALIAEARSIKPVERYYWNAIVRTLTNKQGQSEKNVGPKIYSTGKKLQSKLLRAMTGDLKLGLDGLGDITDVTGVEGCDLQVIKRIVPSGGDAFPDYMESVFKKPSPAGTQAEIDKWLSSLHDLTLLRRILPAEDIAREVRIHRGLEKDPDIAFEGSVIDPMDDDEPIPAPVVRQVTKPQTRPPVTAQVQRPTISVQAPSIDDDESLAGEDFLNKLRGM